MTSFSSEGELLLQFNVSAASNARFSMRGRQITCGPSTAHTSTTFTDDPNHKWQTIATSQAGVDNWKAINPDWMERNWLGTGGRGKGSKRIIQTGSRGVREMKKALRDMSKA